MTENLDWIFYTSIGESQYFELSGINIWNLKWNTEYEIVIVKDPQYGVLKSFNRYWIEKDSKTIEFVAGEFSNTVYGIYLKPDLIEKQKRDYGERTKEKVIQEFLKNYSGPDIKNHKPSIFKFMKSLFRNEKNKG